MADDGVVVKLGADTGDATSSMNDAQASIAASLKGIQDALTSFNDGHKKVVQEAVANNANLSRSFIEMKDSVNGGFNGIIGVIERFRGVMASLVAVVAGGALFEAAIRSSEKFEDSVRTLQQVFGMTAEKATQMSVNLKLAGVSTETYAGMANKASRQLREQNNEFDRLGVVTKDTATGALLPMDQILDNVYTTMQQYKAGTDQTLVSMSLLGRGSIEFAQDMQRIHATTALAKQMVHDFGIEMGPDAQAKVESYRIQVNAFEQALDVLGDKIAAQVMPQLGGLASWLTSEGPEAINAAIKALKYLLEGFSYLVAGVKSAAIQIGLFFQKLSSDWQQAGDLIVAIRHHSLDEIRAVVKAGNDRLAALETQAADDDVEIWKKATDDIKKLWSDTATPAPGVPTGSGPKTYKPKPASGGTDELIQQLKQKLQLEEDSYNTEKSLQGSFEQWSETQTAAYWQNILDTQKLSAKERQAVESEYAKAHLAVMKEDYSAYIANLEEEKSALGENIRAKIALTQQELQAAIQHYGQMSSEAAKYYKELAQLAQEEKKQEQALAKDAEKFQLDLATQELASEQESLNQQVSLRQITSQQKFQIETDMENKIYALKMQEMQNELALLQQGTLAYQQQAEKIELLEVAHQQKLTQIDDAAVLDRKQAQLQADQDVEADFSTLIGDMVNGTKSIKQAFTDFFQSLDKQLSQLAANQIAKQLFGAGTSGGSAVDSLMSKIFGGGAKGASGASGGAADQANAAAVAQDTAAMTTQTATLTAQNPIMVTLTTAMTTLATAAQAAATALMQVGQTGAGSDPLSAIQSFLGSPVPSFDVGTNYVPQDTLAYVHRGETIIPAGMGAGGAGGNRSMQVNNHFNVTGAMDTRTKTQIAALAYSSSQRGAARNL